MSTRFTDPTRVQEEPLGKFRTQSRSSPRGKTKGSSISGGE